MSTEAIEYRRSGWTTFAAVVMFSVAFARVISAINLLAGGDQVNDLTHSLYGGNLWVWGIWDLLIALLAVLAGYSIVSGGILGRVFAYIWAVLVFVQSILLMAVAPWYSVTAIALTCLVFFGLLHDGPEEN